MSSVPATLLTSGSCCRRGEKALNLLELLRRLRFLIRVELERGPELHRVDLIDADQRTTIAWSLSSSATRNILLHVSRVLQHHLLLKVRVYSVVLFSSAEGLLSLYLNWLVFVKIAQCAVKRLLPVSY